MPQRTLSCQLSDPASPDSSHMSPQSDVDTSTTAPHDAHTLTTQNEHLTECSGMRVPLVRGAFQEVADTKSRQSGPRKWLRAVEWLIAAGLHGRANATTLTIACDLADRMDYSTGHVRYCLDEMVARTGISRATVKRHIRYLRELGALAWVQHGTRTNIRSLMGLKGYAATATIYAAVIPAAYDHAMGHTIVGSGYTARIVIDQRGQGPAQNRVLIRLPRQAAPVDNPPVENPSSEGREPPSLTCVEEEGKLKMVGGSNYTPHAGQPKPRIPHQSSSINGRRRTAADVEKASRTTRLVRALVNWTQSVPLRQLEYVLRPWTDQDQDAYQIAADLTGMCFGMRWKPSNPVAYIRARLAADREHEQEIQAAQQEMARWEAENPLEGAFQASPAAQQSVMAALEAGLARYQQQMRSRGHEDLATPHIAVTPAYSDADAAADMAAFLGTTPTPAV